MRFQVLNIDELRKLIDFDDEIALSQADPHDYLDFNPDYYYDRYGDYLWDSKTKQVVAADGGEPEDMILRRNLRHYVDLLNKVAAGE